MDYELMMNGNVRIGQVAPDFSAMTTMGNIKLDDYKGKWVVLFSHPGDFTPVCTTEMIAFSKMNSNFEKINTCLIGLSIDSNPAHLAWMYDIYCKTGIVVPFPIIADRSGEIARRYGMISSNISNTETVRNVYIIDDKKIIRAILVYPMNIGRNIPEILRIVKALQTADANKKMTPANWMPCEPMLVPMPQTFCGLQERLEEIDKQRNGMSWYLSLKTPENCSTDWLYQNNNLNNSQMNCTKNTQNNCQMNCMNNTQSNSSCNTQNCFREAQQDRMVNNQENKIEKKEEKVENREEKVIEKTQENKSQNQKKSGSIQWKNFR